jgi:hypothetical protein
MIGPSKIAPGIVASGTIEPGKAGLGRTGPETIEPGNEYSRVALRAFFLFTLTLTAACNKPVSTLPDLPLPDVRGGAFQLRSQPAGPLLLAFLETVPDTADTPSRSQVVFLSSMAEQYGPRGLRVAVVDASSLALATPPSPNAILNASYDWQLKFPLLLDPGAHLARTLRVEQIPTTFLIAADGHILHQWRGFTRPVVLAFSIEKLLGGPLAQTP